ncbi:Lipocalin-related protein and Bos/Can/Equ allergen [Candidatus Rhodobacter oscarellae]|uniref:Lipocalin-related protein and Bos/Can/Equ allergen n=1 Tax=Candidatus Rhodobacter oscarellae TaxID=1675527 RepID=A0A0J9H550_9RHOB|nr:YeeE/YedE family protein [Candidatus Rhodobacter lobularis]KMW60708.1 Lipocalin-related protein and Bos/Can/Equ allergen [Candidatus Rhodobacter lobularis]
MLDTLGEANTAALIGLVGGLILGLAARLGRFCTLGAIEDFLYSSDDRRLRMWGLAIGAAVISTHLAMSLGALDGAETAYLDRVWNPLATVVGGLMFGYGMALAGNCGYGALARLGGGDLRSFVIVLVLGLSAYFVMSGPLAEFRVWLFPVVVDTQAPQGVSQFAAVRWGVDHVTTGALVGGSLMAVSLASRRMLASPEHIFWGVVVGLAITSGWVGTYWVAVTGFEVEPIETHSFAAPIGDTIFYSMTASGNTLSFSVGSVVGVVAGAFIGSIRKGHFRWEACEDPRELRRQILGAALMGPGAILAVGCSVGQGLSAFSVLAFSAPIAFISIFLGAMLGLRQLIVGFSPAE